MNRIFDIEGALSQIYSACGKGDSDGALDIILDIVDDLLDEARFVDCDNLLSAADVTKLDETAIIGFLATTVVAKSQLTEREAFMERMLKELHTREEILFFAKIDGLLKGLR